MVSGLNQNVEVLGRVFHVQTEVISGEDKSHSKIQTTVFLEGKVIGSRELPLERDNVSDEWLCSQRDQQHQAIVTSLVTRMNRLQEQRQAPGAPPVEPGQEAAAGLTGSTTAEPQRPRAEEDKNLLGAIRTRRLLGRFRGAIDVTPPSSPEQLCEVLRKAVVIIENIVSSIAFREIRLDEQVRFNLLKQKIEEWLGGERIHDNGVRIWSEVVVFSSYLSKINNREELRSFDRRLLIWGLYALRTEGMTEEVHRHLQLLFGADVTLDALLDTPAEQCDAEHWLPLLQGLVDELDAGIKPSAPDELRSGV